MDYKGRCVAEGFLKHIKQVRPVFIVNSMQLPAT